MTTSDDNLTNGADVAHMARLNHALAPTKTKTVETENLAARLWGEPEDDDA